MTELAPPQISSLMEALPGIAAVLRSPVATAIVSLSRAAAGLEPFQLAHAEELLRYGVRRTLLTQDEVDKVLVDLKEVAAKMPKLPPPEKVAKESPAPSKASIIAHPASKVPPRPGSGVKPLVTGKGSATRPIPTPPPPAPAKPMVKAPPPKTAPAAVKAPAVKVAAKPVVKVAAKPVVKAKPAPAPKKVVPVVKKAATKKVAPVKKVIPAKKSAKKR